MSSTANVQARFQHWITERHAMYLRRAEGRPAPWTTDAILREYRFCNVYRQLDAVTVRLNKEFFPKFDAPYLPFATIVARLINEPDCLADLVEYEAFGYERKSWNPVVFTHILNSRKAKGKLIRNTAYIVSTNGMTLPFPEYITKHVLNDIWVDRRSLIPAPGRPLADYAEKLQGFNGLGSFLAGQVVADLKYHHPALHPKKVDDWYTFVVPGPGSKRGLNRLYGVQYDKALADRVFHERFPLAVQLAEAACEAAGYPRPHAQDVQNCLCEFDKYERTLHGQGTPKQRYTPPDTDNLLF